MQLRSHQPPETVSAQAVRRGEPAAFDRLYEGFAPRVLGYLLRLTSNRADAEDLLQETFLAAYEGRKGYALRSQPLAWLLGIARRRWRDGQRNRHPTESPPEELAAPGNFTEAVNADLAASTLLAHLPVADREIIFLSVIQQLSYREIAVIIEKPVGTVKWRAAESLKRLRQLSLADQEETSGRHADTTENRTTVDPAADTRNYSRSDGSSADRKSARIIRRTSASPDCP